MTYEVAKTKAASRLVFVAVVLSGAMLPAAAQEVAVIPFVNTPAGTTGLGGGLRFGQTLYRDADNEEQRRTDLVPLYLYNGKRLYAHGTSGGVHVFDTGTIRFNALARYRFTKLDPSSNAYYSGLSKRRQTLDAGVEMALHGDWGNFRVTWLADVLDRNNGQSIDVAYRYDFDRGRWTLSPFIAWSYYNANLTNYYYGVSAGEAMPDRPEYTPGASKWLAIGMNTSWWVSDRISLFANVAFGGPDSAVTDSPLVENGSGSALFVGGSYVFGNVHRPESYVSPERRSEWSWRINYGYQAEGNIVSEIDQGDFSKSKYADTNIGGLTLSKLLTDGPRVDFLGRVALFRHFEADEGNGNFNSYAAYVMAMGKGYSPWSKQEVFRWGFGFGMSYAEKVPIAEQRKQAAKNNNTSHFLNYLEMTLDFPLRRVFESEAIRNCYAGVTVVHRSGIFNTSDLLGDVGGGADWITAHLECVRS
jgi:outer membrane scaffolding protein for murein synthesis (MipA/OmpV family)